MLPVPTTVCFRNTVVVLDDGLTYRVDSAFDARGLPTTDPTACVMTFHPKADGKLYYHAHRIYDKAKLQ